MAAFSSSMLLLFSLVIILSTPVDVFSTKTLLGASLCTRGPGHWCQNIETAKSCDAVKYCEQKVWIDAAAPAAPAAGALMTSVPLVPVDHAVEILPMTVISEEAKPLPAASSSSTTANLDLCTYCEEVVNYAKILLGNPDAEKEIEALLEGMCTQLGPLKEPCEEFIAGNIKKIVETLAHLDTKQVCVELHMCSASLTSSSSSSSGEVPRQPPVYPLAGLSTVRSLVCDKCSKFSLNVIERLQNSATSLSQMSVEYCHSIGRDDLLCHHHMGVFLAAAKVVGSDKYFCQFLCEKKDEASLSFCPSEQASSPLTATPPTTAGPQPPACTQCIQALKLMKQDLTAKIACLENKLEHYCDAFPPLAAECKAAVEGFFKPLHEQIDQVDPKALCIQIGVCNPTKGDGGKLKIPPNMDLCLNCEQTMNYAKIVIGEPGFEAQIEGVLLSMCNNFGPLKDGCVRYIEDNIQQLFEKLKHLDSRVICKDLGFCPSKPKLVENSFFDTPIQLLPVGLLGGVDRPILNFHPEDDVDGATETKTTATTDHVVRLAKKAAKNQDVSIHNVATDAKVATMNHDAKSVELPQMSCFTCKFIMGEGKRILEEESTVDQLTKLSEKICQELNTDLKAQCQDFLSIYAKTYIKMAVEQLSPSQICIIMGSCEGKPSPTGSPHHSGNPLLCFGCERGLQELVDTWRRDKGLRTKVLNTLQSACLQLPDQKTIQDCVDEVDVMFPVFSKFILDLNTKQVCINAGVCSNDDDSSPFQKFLPHA